MRLRLEPRAGRTVLAHKSQHGPLTVQRGFHPEGAPCHLYLLHPPGGVVGGDRLTLEVEVAAGAHALLTTPGAAKFYRSAGPLAVQRQRLVVADGGRLEWLPHEGILFPGARLDLATTIELGGDARFIGWEVTSLGRPVLGERFTPGTATLALALARDGRPLLRERLRLADGCGLTGPAGLRGWPVTATFIATGATADDLAHARTHLPADPAALPAGLTLLDDLLVARLLGPGVEPVLARLRQLWALLRPRLLGLPACPPRIWAT